MPSVKIPRKSTFVDMTPFVDVAFLILTFFIMATKFKAQEPVQVVTPNSVSVKELEERDALQVTFDSAGHVYFNVISQKGDAVKKEVIKRISDTKGLNLSETDMRTFVKGGSVGVPFGNLKQLFALSEEDVKNFKQPGVPLDTLGGELYWWIRESVGAFSGRPLDYLIKGDNAAKYPAFKNVLTAFKKNDIYKFKMITNMEDAPAGSELDIMRKRQKAGGK